jgi:hypothetical protein
MEGTPVTVGTTNMLVEVRDFTLRIFERLLEQALRSFGTVCGVAQWLADKPARAVLLRHDVDRRPANAVAMARREHALGIRCTYYFRVVGSAYDPAAMETVASLGHEVGYHYEDLTLARGDRVLALSMFEEHLAMLRKHADVRTITMHGSPLSRFNNADIWRSKEYRNFGIEADAFMDIDYREIPYFTDTGRGWDAHGRNFRDFPPHAVLGDPGVRTTEELRAYLASTAAPRVAIAAHPERWDDGLIPWCVQAAKDRGINGAKRLLRLARRGSG